MLKAKYLEAIGRIKAADNILLVVHARPDGDALASLCAMAEILELHGKNYGAYSHDEAPPEFSYLANFEKITNDKNALDFPGFDLIITLDCGQLSRTMLAQEISGRSKGQQVIEIDHHPKIQDYADLEIRDSGASSTCELIYGLADANRIEINKNLATAILTGLMTDTGNFFYNSTTEKTVKIASEMMKRGAKYPLIINNTWRNKSINGLKIWGLAMRRLFINPKYKIAVTVLTRKDFKKYPATEEEAEGISGFLSNIAEADTLLVLHELDNGCLRGSLRSANKGKDVSRLAKRLGGGGHPLASGFILEAELAESRDGWLVS